MGVNEMERVHWHDWYVNGGSTKVNQKYIILVVVGFFSLFYCVLLWEQFVIGGDNIINNEE